MKLNICPYKKIKGSINVCTLNVKNIDKCPAKELNCSWFGVNFEPKSI